MSQTIRAPEPVSYSCSCPGGEGTFLEIQRRNYHDSHVYRIELRCPPAARHPLIEVVEQFIGQHPEYVLKSMRLCDEECMARTAHSEGSAGGEELVRAICWVIWNRYQYGHGMLGRSVQEVCQMPGVFPCWNADSPLRAKMLRMHREDGSDYAHALEIARDVMTCGLIGDPTGGAMFYCPPAHLAHVPDPFGVRVIKGVAFYSHDYP